MQFKYLIHSYRYYDFPDIATVVAKVYPDIKWVFHLFLNLSNKASVKWQKLSAKKHRDMQSEAGNMTETSDNRQDFIDNDFSRQSKTSDEYANEMKLFSAEEKLTIQSSKTVNINSAEKSKLF
ncbi:hypothetical protein [uncultured Marixanthomonas sp.]|uniref:hypothetical protein n=1 Tax=uncultured Marixanthomonas sp. TaxID=757245 RepID=UPI0030DAA547|tara:strand:- start:179070 stop:179438 length:369 start_codon:yes stop_codon:yes gene_type:complete